MICPNCKKDNTKVLESRDTEGGFVVRRRRECEDCKHRFTTFEKIEITNFLVVKKNGAREPYNREKLERGIWISCSKRPVSQKQIDDLLYSLEQKWMNYGKEINSEVLGQDVVKALQNIDEIAYIRFASVYKNFKNIENFQEELVDFLRKK